MVIFKRVPCEIIIILNFEGAEQLTIWKTYVLIRRKNGTDIYPASFCNYKWGFLGVIYFTMEIPLLHKPRSLNMYIQYIPRNMHTVFDLLCFVVVVHWLIFPYPSGLLHWHCGNLTIAPVPAKQPWWIWIDTSCEFIMNDCIATTKQSTTKPCAYFLGYTVVVPGWLY